MKMLAEYLDRAINFELMAAEEKEDRFKAGLLARAAAYRRLAAKRAAQLKLAPSPQTDGAGRQGSEPNDSPHSTVMRWRMR
jgi:hypothetical protein